MRNRDDKFVNKKIDNCVDTLVELSIGLGYAMLVFLTLALLFFFIYLLYINLCGLIKMQQIIVDRLGNIW